ncbi:MAG: hypothetical protein P4L44_08900 [Oryzomonas sp.]|uniref:hypothetical protein n=1 Tax=Oryzomonas sp. TaxID=2855186 RepID=UPI00283AF2BA|nr:hypothetical protein [Oryzomonas sp.]MDR3580065.1 hypothetical protein [Oryzomonas sp.]
MRRLLCGMLSSLLLIVSISMLCSTSAFCKDLSRSEAKKILSKYYPQVISTNINHKYTPSVASFYLNNGKLSDGDSELVRQTENFLKPLQDAGFITFSGRTQEKRMMNQIMLDLWFEVSPTAKLIPYIVNKGTNYDVLKVCTVVVNEITGIVKKTNNERYVEYTVKYVTNALYPLFMNQVNINYNDNKRSATFILYDDGWRLAQ